VAVQVNLDPPDLSERSLAGGGIAVVQLVSNAGTNTVRLAGEGVDSVTRVVVPVGALTASTTTLRAVSGSTSLPPPPGDAGFWGAAVEVTLGSGQTQMSGGKTSTLTFEYPDADDDGVVDGTEYLASKQAVYSYDASLGRWVRESDVVVDVASRTVTAATRHFSFFGVFVPVSANLDNVWVYPNPYVPNGGNAEEGTPYRGGDPDSGITFENLAADTTIEIFSVSGAKVARLSASGTAGKVRWDAKNDSGRDVSSGVYMAVLTSPGIRRVVKKVAIVR
jgi:hypothetical protein